MELAILRITVCSGAAGLYVVVGEEPSARYLDTHGRTRIGAHYFDTHQSIADAVSRYTHRRVDEALGVAHAVE